MRNLVFIRSKTHTDAQLKEIAGKPLIDYPNDLDAGLETELKQFAHLFKFTSQEPSTSNGKRGINSVELEMYELIHTHDMVESFANVEILLRLYLCMFVTNCTGYRSFSKLKLVKTISEILWDRII